ncbi:hypothetical protein M8C21_016999 [Ambrosia artemisiifolia]|uniref:Uncharacterized protein n=1 Tax=Ambrosia artemisiifolia TaxID=4212 RepID=A0AAD5CJX2_AMBAR|nr:hypothetical protein M8C21_016999 [Ambrosia artemisiifolia]
MPSPKKSFTNNKAT